jgi:two-component system chemotaxis response regulator CheB
MPGHDIICIGASAGGVEVLLDIVRELPADLPAAVFVVVHVPPNSSTVLPAVLNRAGKLPASHAASDEPIRRGRIYVARPDLHLLVKDGPHPRVMLGRGPKENSARPAVDPLFRSAARAFGPRVIGVILSGSLDDGTVGLDVIKRAGGLTVVQDPEQALFPGMPRSAVENVAVDHVVPKEQIASLLVRLANEPVLHAEVPMPDHIKQEADMAELSEGSIKSHERPGQPSGFSCPECHGTLFELSDGRPIRFRCRTGHAYSAESLMAEQADNLEAAMYTAMTALKERSALADRLAERARERGHDITARQFAEQARDAERQAELIRQALLAAEKGPQGGPVPSDGNGEEDAREREASRGGIREPG